MTRGGKRDGAGRGSLYGEKTKTVRLPERIADVVREVLQISDRAESGQSIREDAVPAVWWLSQEELVSLVPERLRGSDVPEYILSQCEDSMGRNGRGRLWAEQGFKLRLLNPMPEADRKVGIVVQKKDLVQIVLFPGTIQLDCQWEPRECT